MEETPMRTVKSMTNRLSRPDSDDRQAPGLQDESQAVKPYRRFAGRLLAPLGSIILPVIAALAAWGLWPAAANSQSALVPGETTMSITIGAGTAHSCSMCRRGTRGLF